MGKKGREWENKKQGGETRVSTDDSSVGLSEGVRMTVPRHEAKTGEKRHRENKICLRATVSLYRRKRSDHTGEQNMRNRVGDVRRGDAIHKRGKRCLNTCATFWDS